MKKSIILAAFLCGSVFGNVCSDSLKFDFTFYGSPNKEYVVTKNTFTKYEANFIDSKLLNATLKIDATSLDTSADLNNMGATWPAAMARTRSANTVNQFFRKFEVDPGIIETKVVNIDENAIEIEFKMNGVTKILPFAYKIEDNTLKANSKLEILDFNTQKAWENFQRICEKVFHHGKSWSEIDVNFQIDANCK